MSEEGLVDVVNDIRLLGIDRDVIKVITTIEGIVVNETPLRIGKGRGELGEADLPVLRDPSGVPYVPGSSLKGAVRAFLEALARGSGYDACTPFTPSRCAFGAELLNLIFQEVRGGATLNDVVGFLSRKDRRLEEIARRWFGDSSEAIIEDILNVLEKEGISAVIRKYAPCLICRLFGNQALASRVTFFDLYPQNPELLRTQVRTRVAIDRFREAARSKALFQYEFIPPNYRWVFRMEVRNLDLTNCEGDECRLLLTFLRIFTSEGLSVGGMKSVGHGVLKLLPEETSVIVHRVSSDLTLEKTVCRLSELIKA